MSYYDFLVEFGPRFLSGLQTTAVQFLLAAALATVVSLVMGLGKLSDNPLLRWPAVIYIEFFRGTSLLVQLFWLFYVLPQFGIKLSPWVAGMGNYLVGIFKDTPMLSVIGVAELMHAANAIGGQHYRYLEPYTIMGVVFLLISLPSAGLIRAFETWVRRKLGLV